MMQKFGFKLFIWFITTFFFFLSSAVIISELRPGPSELDAMRFMESMMGAMEKSMMGVSMGIENDASIQRIISISAVITIPIIFIGALAGVLIRFFRRGDKDV